MDTWSRTQNRVEWKQKIQVKVEYYMRDEDDNKNQNKPTKTLIIRH